jgi:hypothetical protein
MSTSQKLTRFRVSTHAGRRMSYIGTWNVREIQIGVLKKCLYSRVEMLVVDDYPLQRRHVGQRLGKASELC